MRTHNVLFLCGENAARAVMAEAILNAKAHGRFAAYSAGSDTSGEVQPQALAEIEGAGIAVDGLRCKSRDEFLGPEAPRMDFVFILRDSETNERCPEWPGNSEEIAHWNIPDPAKAAGASEDVARAFHDAFTLLDRRINLFLALPAATLNELVAQQHMRTYAAAA